jgi:hypothetical protein
MSGNDVVFRGNQKGQADFLADRRAGETCYIGGWGSGKTWAAARKFLYFHALNECPGLVVAPTYQALFRFCVPELEAACKELRWPYKLYPKGRAGEQFAHAMICGRPLLLVSSDAAQSIAGFQVGHIWIDEAARCQESEIDPTRDTALQCRGRLRHPAAKVRVLMASTTPEGMGTWVHRDFCGEEPKAGRRLYRGRTADNTALTADYTSMLLESMPAELAQQYLEGKPADYSSNRAHKVFDKALHVVTGAPWRRGPVYIGADFNVSPLCWVACQIVPEHARLADGVTPDPLAGRLVVLDELVIDDWAQVDDAMQRCAAKGWGRWGPVHFCPDKSGNARNRVGDSEVLTAQASARQLGWDFRVNVGLGVNPPVNNRINLVSRLLRNGKGESVMRVSAGCLRLIDELASTGRKSNGYDPGTKGDRGHILDALGYACWEIYAPGQKVGAMRLG